MDLILNKEQVYLSEVVYDGQTEQGVEFDYILPDYYPDIFKILKCRLMPKVVSYNISGDKLVCDGVVYIKVLYLGENNNCINCVEQRYTYSKTIDLGKDVEGLNPIVTITPKVDYCNCRAVSGRRIDVRGAVSCKVRVTCSKMAEVVSEAEGKGIEAKKSPFTYSGKKLHTKKQFTTREDIEVSSGGEGIENILNHDVVAVVTDFKVIAGKVIVKGEANVKALYTCKVDEENEEAEVMEATIPLSQIIDLDGVTEQHLCFVEITVITADLTVKKNNEGDSKVFGCEVVCECAVTAHKEETADVITDIYSTKYESNYSTVNVKAEGLPQIISQPLTERTTVESSDGELETVYDAWADLQNVTCKGKSDKEMVVSGQLNCQLLGKISGGSPVYMEKQVPLEATVEVTGLSPSCVAEHSLQVTSVSFSISSGNAVDLRIQMSFKCCLYQIKAIEVVSDVTVMEDKPKKTECDYALKLYFAEAGEDVWAIAKRYNTSIDSITGENDIEGDKITASTMLLIPIV